MGYRPFPGWWARVLERALQAGIVVLVGVGVASANLNVVVNGVVAFAVTLLPAVAERDLGVRLGTPMTAVLALAVFLHVVGMAGLYDVVGWWDHLTHTLSAGVVATTGYVTVRALEEHSDAVTFTPRFAFAFVFLVTVALGVLWEVLEFVGREVALAFGHGPVLVQYGLGDTMLDLVFDGVGAVVAAVVAHGGVQRFVRAMVRGVAPEA